MKILIKQLPPEVESCSGFIVYVMDDNDNPITAKICDYESLANTLEEFKLKYEI